MATNKAYIGSGKATQYDGVRVSMRMEDVEKHIRKAESGSWLNFIVAPKKEADEKGRTHNVFVFVDEPTGEAASQVSEPAVMPEGATVMEGGRRLKKITKAQAEKIRKSQSEA